MPRKKRVVRQGYCYHVILRGNGGQDIFKDQEDRVRFCLFLQYAVEGHQLTVHGFCLMSNHVHLVLQPKLPDLSTGLHTLSFRYAQYFNQKYERQGHLFQGRFKSIIVQTGDYLRRLIRYIHLNPVRAGIVHAAGGYIWSSHRAYMGQMQHTWLKKELVLEAFGKDSSSAVTALGRYVQMEGLEANHEALDIQRSVRSGAYGDPAFLEALYNELNEQEQSNAVNWMPELISLDEVIDTVCEYLSVSIEDVQSAKRESDLVQARALIAMLTKDLRVSSLSGLAKRLSRDPTSLARLARKGGHETTRVAIIRRLKGKLRSYA